MHSRGGLERELVVHLRTDRALRKPQAPARQQAWAHVTPATLLSERPAEVAGRSVVGLWEGDLLIVLNRSAVATLVERKTQFTALVHLPRREVHGLTNKKRGPKFAGYSAMDMTGALTKAIAELPATLWRTLTWDRGKELPDHLRMSAQTGVSVYFADPSRPWQRATNENTNGH